MHLLPCFVRNLCEKPQNYVYICFKLILLSVSKPQPFLQEIKAKERIGTKETKFEVSKCSPKLAGTRSASPSQRKMEKWASLGDSQLARLARREVAT
jgi:hypothetical protein